MAYTINRYNGSALVTIADGDSNTSASSIFLVGRNYASYGEYLEENILHVMENFSNTIQPSNPLSGQLWYDSSNKRISVYDGSVFKSLAVSFRSPTTPNNPLVGEYWWDTTNDQLKIYNSTEWSLIGPAYSKVDGQSGAIVEKIYDISNNPHVVVKMMTAGTVDAIISKDSTFTPLTPIANFTTISAGINLASTQKMYGTSTNSERLGNILAANYARTDLTTPFYSLLDVRADTGIKVGASSLFQLSTVNGNVVLENAGASKTLKIRTNVSGTISEVFTVGTDGLITVKANPTSLLGISTKGYVDTITGNVNSSLTQAINANVSTLNTTITNLTNVVNTKAPLASPILTGNPTSPTPLQSDNSTRIATTEFVKSMVGTLGTMASQNAHSVAITGGTIGGVSVSASTIKAVAGISDDSNGIRVVNPGGASYSSNLSSVTGAIKIKLPVAAFNSNTMLRFTVKLYEYNTGYSRTIDIGGYNYAGDSSWHNWFATQTSQSGDDINVRFGQDSTSDCIWIGETNSVWQYPQIFVTDFQAGYSNATQAKWSTGWAISIVTTLDTVQQTTVASRPLTSSNYNSYSPSLTGTGASGTWSISISGNSATATKFSTTRANYRNISDTSVSGELMWKNYGNGHTIFDASNSTTPTGASCNRSNAQVPWTPSYPTLMGYNGANTYGVRVDSARISDTATNFYGMPSGTRLMFAQASAPTGWTQVTDDSANNRMMRVVTTGGGQTGGTHDPVYNNVVASHSHGFTTGGHSNDHAHYFSVATASSGNHTHGVYDPGHAHSVYDPGHTHYYIDTFFRELWGNGQNYGVGSSGGQDWDNTDYDRGRYTYGSGTGIGIYSRATGIGIYGAGDHTHTAAGWTGGAGSNHTHSGSTDGGSSQTAWQPRYINMILCVKN